MFDFRYHALSLGAVFLALGVGILLGVTIGDSLVSDADRSLRTSLRNDVVDARGEAREAQQGIDRRDEALEKALPTLVAGQLVGQRVALVASGSLPDGVESKVKDAVEQAGGVLDSRSVVALPEDAAEVQRAAATSGSGSGTARATVESAGRRVGLSLVRGGPLMRRLEQRLPKRFEGDYRGVGAVVFYRSPPDEEEPDADPSKAQERKDAEAFEKAMIEALVDQGATVAGIEQWRTDPSQVPFYRSNDLSSVDSVDLPAGQIALVYVLAGERGTFGMKGSAERAVPDLSGG